MIDSIRPNEWKRFIWAAVACFIIYAAVDVWPMIASIASGELNTKVIEKSAAENRAAAFAEKQTGLKVKSAKAVHQTDKMLNGYLSKNKLVKTYAEKYDPSFPTDTFQVDLKFAGGGSGFVYVHMQSEKIVAWNLLIDGEPLPDAVKTEAVISFLSAQSFSGLDFRGSKLLPNGDWHGEPPSATIMKAQLKIDVNALNIDGRTVITKYKPAFVAPDDYIQLCKEAG